MTSPPAEGALWLIRHGHTVVHGSGGVAGRTDVELSDGGRAAVRALGASSAGGSRARALAARWFASPLGRTRESAGILRGVLEGEEGAGAPRGADRAAPPSSADEERSVVDERFTIDARLVELDFGDWEGSTWEAVHREHGAALAAWGEDWVTRAPPNGERFVDQAARCRAWFDEHLGDAPPQGDERARDALVVAHGGSIRALVCALLGRPLGEAMRFAIDPAAAFRLERDARLASGWRLVGANLGDLG